MDPYRRLSRGERMVKFIQLKSKSDRIHRLMIKVSDWITKYLDVYLTVQIRPRVVSASNDYIERAAAQRTPHGRVALLMQGPPVLQDDFTYQSLVMYRRCHPDCSFVYSTWDSVDDVYAARIEQLGIKILRSPMPASGGDGNAGFQVLSTQIGLQYIKENIDVDFVLKTRSDQRFYNPNTLAFLQSLLDVFPAGNGQISRLVHCGVSRQNLLYFPSDMLVFGHIEEQLRYWQLPDWSFMARNKVEPSIFKHLWTESHLCRSYLQRMGYSAEEDLKTSQDLLAKHFIILDRAQLDLFWPKHNYRYIETFAPYVQHAKEEGNFANWLIAYAGGSDILAANLAKRFTDNGAFYIQDYLLGPKANSEQNVGVGSAHS